MTYTPAPADAPAVVRRLSVAATYRDSRGWTVDTASATLFAASRRIDRRVGDFVAERVTVRLDARGAILSATLLRRRGLFSEFTRVAAVERREAGKAETVMAWLEDTTEAERAALVSTVLDVRTVQGRPMTPAQAHALAEAVDRMPSAQVPVVYAEALSVHAVVVDAEALAASIGTRAQDAEKAAQAILDDTTPLSAQDYADAASQAATVAHAETYDAPRHPHAERIATVMTEARRVALVEAVDAAREALDGASGDAEAEALSELADAAEAVLEAAAYADAVVEAAAEPRDALGRTAEQAEAESIAEHRALLTAVGHHPSTAWTMAQMFTDAAERAEAVQALRAEAVAAVQAARAAAEPSCCDHPDAPMHCAHDDDDDARDANGMLAGDATYADVQAALDGALAAVGALSSPRGVGTLHAAYQDALRAEVEFVGTLVGEGITSVEDAVAEAADMRASYGLGWAVEPCRELTVGDVLVLSASFSGDVLGHDHDAATVDRTGRAWTLVERRHARYVGGASVVRVLECSALGCSHREYVQGIASQVDASSMLARIADDAGITPAML